MAAFTTIAATTVAIGGQVAKGILAGDAASTSARQAGRFQIEKTKLEEDSVAKLEQNYFDEVRLATDIYDRKLQQDNVMGATILHAAQEGDQRGVGASAGKVKAASDVQTDKTAEKFADKKVEIDLARAAAGEKSAEEIAALMDDRAQAAGVKADALNKQANDLEGQSTGAYLQAGVGALSAGIKAFGGLAGGKNAMGKAADALVKKSGGTLLRADALKQVDGMTFDQLGDIKQTGLMPTTEKNDTEIAVPDIGVNTKSSDDATDIEALMNKFLDTEKGKKYLDQRNKSAFGFFDKLKTEGLGYIG
jgi:hypothetical protein